MSAISKLTGESTTTASVGAASAGAPTLVTPPGVTTQPKKTSRLKKIVARHPAEVKKVSEAESFEEPVIPASAQTVASGDKTQTQSSRPGGETLISTSVALVAPDTTPEAEKPLDPTQVPQPLATSEPSSASVPQAAPATSARKPENSLDQLFQFHQAAATESLKFASPSGSAPIDVNAVETGKKSVVETQAKVKASTLISSSMSGSSAMPPPDTRNPNEVMSRSIGAFRAIFGDQ